MINWVLLFSSAELNIKVTRQIAHFYSGFHFVSEFVKITIVVICVMALKMLKCFTVQCNALLGIECIKRDAFLCTALCLSLNLFSKVFHHHSMPLT